MTSLLLVLCLATGFSQNFRYEVRGKYSSGVSKEKLSTTKTMSDIRPGYPTTWVNDYISTQILLTSNGKVLKALGRNESLSAEQQSLLLTAEVGNEITVDVGYIYLNAATGIPDIRKMHFVEKVVLEIEAQFLGGHEGLSMYFDKNAIQKMPENGSNDINAILTFTVTETGEISNVQVLQPCKDPQVDKLLLKAISKMPKWIPAQNSKGIGITQEFEFIVGMGGC